MDPDGNLKMQQNGQESEAAGPDRTFDLFTGPAWQCDLLITLLGDAGIAAFRTEYANIYGATPIFDANCRTCVMESDREAAEEVLRRYLENQEQLTEEQMR
ncbi:MAG: hypothetical protein IJS25_05005 [Bacteroidales bacterium]|nr:hypothetical protein [Bacteroidales bacterium]